MKKLNNERLTNLIEDIKKHVDESLKNGAVPGNLFEKESAWCGYYRCEDWLEYAFSPYFAGLNMPDYGETDEYEENLEITEQDRKAVNDVMNKYLSTKK